MIVGVTKGFQSEHEISLQCGLNVGDKLNNRDKYVRIGISTKTVGDFFGCHSKLPKISLLVGKGNAEVALSLVGYDQELKVAFNREIGTPSVTLDGDIFQPSGLLSGGSRKKEQQRKTLNDCLNTNSGGLVTLRNKNGEIQESFGGIITECDTDSPIEHVLSPENAVMTCVQSSDMKIDSALI
ncbi:Structural maintenance of chromosomes protein 2-2 [Camellia lanceoleosa]|uniref:Structural maintenance of chromosomes protein 2-2 n=1 Tax=Camellia lanceoleosa TaxID=1840588 RepID=A0ACC0G7K5_9ERIC|nr:Structural maintenance of chromosomes protein 2-2 [Camellia lanceoleosa]